MSYTEQFILAKTKAGFDAANSAGNIENESIAFIEESGKEGIHTQGKTYQTIPSGGNKGQVLASDGERGSWSDIDSLTLDEKTYGISWETGGTPNVTRVGNLDLHRSLPIQSGMKGCIYRPDLKQVVYWLDEDDWRFKADHPSDTFTNDQAIVASVNVSTNIAQRGLSQMLYDYGIGGQLFEEGDVNNDFYIKINRVVCLVKNNYLEYISTGVYNYQTTIVPISGDLDIPVNSTVTVELGSKLWGYDGEVMVYVPEFYIKFKADSRYREVRVSQTKIDDTWVHQPALFMSAYRNTLLREKVNGEGYLSTLVANSALSVANRATYCRGGDNDASYDEDTMATTRLGKCATTVDVSDFRSYARKANKEIMSHIQYRNIIFWLWAIEYGSFNSLAPFNSTLDSNGFKQGGLGNGPYASSNTELTPSCPNGYTNNIGNGTSVKVLLGRGEANRWRGIENVHGDVAQYVEGIVINETNSYKKGVYVTDDPTKYGLDIEVMDLVVKDSDKFSSSGGIGDFYVIDDSTMYMIPSWIASTIDINKGLGGLFAPSNRLGLNMVSYGGPIWIYSNAAKSSLTTIQLVASTEQSYVNKSYRTVCLAKESLPKAPVGFPGKTISTNDIENYNPITGEMVFIPEEGKYGYWTGSEWEIIKGPSVDDTTVTFNYIGEISLKNVQNTGYRYAIVTNTYPSFYSENTIYDIRSVFSGTNISIGKNCVLVFNGGAFKNCTVNLNNAIIAPTSNEIFNGSTITNYSGPVYPEWFAHSPSYNGNIDIRPAMEASPAPRNIVLGASTSTNYKLSSGWLPTGDTCISSMTRGSRVTVNWETISDPKTANDDEIRRIRLDGLTIKRSSKIPMFENIGNTIYNTCKIRLTIDNCVAISYLYKNSNVDCSILNSYISPVVYGIQEHVSLIDNIVVDDLVSTVVDLEIDHCRYDGIQSSNSLLPLIRGANLNLHFTNNKFTGFRSLVDASNGILGGKLVSTNNEYIGFTYTVTNRTYAFTFISVGDSFSRLISNDYTTSIDSEHYAVGGTASKIKPACMCEIAATNYVDISNAIIDHQKQDSVKTMAIFVQSANLSYGKIMPSTVYDSVGSGGGTIDIVYDADGVVNLESYKALQTNEFLAKTVTEFPQFVIGPIGQQLKSRIVTGAYVSKGGILYRASLVPTEASDGTVTYEAKFVPVTI